MIRTTESRVEMVGYIDTWASRSADGVADDISRTLEDLVADEPGYRPDATFKVTIVVERV